MAVFKTPQLPDDLDPGTLTDGMVPVYDSTAQRWVPGSGTSGSSNLLVVSGSVTLDDGVDVGTLVGYRATASTTFTGQGGSVTLAAGAYIFERVSGGWEYRTLVEGTGLTPPAPDTTPPTAGTLAVTGVTHNAATLTVTGASDNQALHASPYAFSTNNGSTWTGYQSSNVYAASGLTPSTSYEFRHKVRDAQGNETTGTAVTQSTASAPVVWTELFTDTFTAADGTNIVGRSPAAGHTWEADTTAMMTKGTAVVSSKITGNKAVSASVSSAQVIPKGASDKVRITFDYTTTSTTGAAMSVAITKTPTGLNGFYGFMLNLGHTGNASVTRGVGNAPVGVGSSSGQTALTGTIVLEYDGTTLKATQNGTQFVSESLPGYTTTHVGFAFNQMVGQAIDNFKVETLP